MRIEQPVANGLSTDHPVPGLPFVDDSHLPLQDGKGIEKHGRHDHNEGWGRYDDDRNNRARWAAFTDDQFDLSWAWCVRHEPGCGRTVLLYHSEDADIMHPVLPQARGGPWRLAGTYHWPCCTPMPAPPPHTMSPAPTEQRPAGGTKHQTAEYSTGPTGTPPTNAPRSPTTVTTLPTRRNKPAHPRSLLRGCWCDAPDVHHTPHRTTRRL